MQRDRDSEICLIHFTLIHRLALPDTTTFLTVMLLCMIAPGLDSSITAVSVRFFLIEASLIRHGHSRARNPFDNGRFANCWNFWCQPRWPAARGLLLCSLGCVSVPSQCLHVTKMQYIISVYCIQVSDCALQMPSLHSKLSLMSSVKTKFCFGLVLRMPRASSEQVKNSMHASLDSI